MRSTQEILRETKAAAPALALASPERKNALLLSIADSLMAHEESILAANARDIEAAREKLGPVMIDRLTLTPARIAAMAEGVREVAALPDPVGKELSRVTRPNGLVIRKVSVPLGVVIPVSVEDLLVADKAVSVDWEMNGAVRLQPVLLGLGQAAGALAAIAARSGRHPSEVPAAEVQSVLLDHGCYLLPFLDLKPGEQGFRELQEQGIRGEVRGIGRTVGWANETWVNLPVNN